MSDEKPKIQMFDDGSKAFKLLYNELKENFNILVKSVRDSTDIDDILLDWFKHAEPDKKSYLHFTNEDLTKNDEYLRKQVEKVERIGYKNQVVLPYEGMDNRTVEQRYATIKAVPEEIAEQVKKAERIDPDSEMKNAEPSEKPFRFKAEQVKNAERLKKPSEGKSRATEKEVVGKIERLYEVKIDNNNIDDVMNERKENFKNQRRRKKSQAAV